MADRHISVAVMMLAAFPGPVPARGADVSRIPYGVTRDGHKAEAVVLTASNGIKARIITYGARLQSLSVPDRDGRLDDIILGYDDLAGYEADTSHQGSTVGRFGNRIARGQFILDGERHELALNNGANHLHGGVRGFGARLWTIESVTGGARARLVLRYVSADGEEGYPGTLTARAIFTLDDRGEMSIEYRAETDRTTIVNLTHHSYFNLAGGQSARSALDQMLTLKAGRFTPTDAGLIPTGKLADVSGTPMDFRAATRIGERVRAPYPPLQLGRGYDHNFVIDGAPGTLRSAARLEDPQSGRAMDIMITAPALQFYSGNFLDGSLVGKGGEMLRQGDGICLEPQTFPDAPNQPSFPSPRLEPGQAYSNMIVFRFSTFPR